MTCLSKLHMSLNLRWLIIDLTIIKSVVVVVIGSIGLNSVGNIIRGFIIAWIIDMT